MAVADRFVESGGGRRTAASVVANGPTSSGTRSRLGFIMEPEGELEIAPGRLLTPNSRCSHAVLSEREWHPRSFLFFFEKGATGFSYSLRD
jgi:hypothetical protein